MKGNEEIIIWVGQAGYASAWCFVSVLQLLLIQLIFYLVKVYDGRGTLEEGETAEARFIKIQAAYELLIDEEKRKQYDMDNCVNPMK